MADKVTIVSALPPGALHVGYSGTPEDQEKERLQLEWGQNVEKVHYRGTEYWILPKKKEKTDKCQPKDKKNDKPSTKTNAAKTNPLKATRPKILMQDCENAKFHRTAR